MNDKYDSTIKKKIKERLSDVPQEEIDKAQVQLNEWCKEFGIKPWRIDARQADWRELCYCLLGLPPATKEVKKKGRPSKYDEEFEWKVYWALADYSFLATDAPPLKGRELYKKVAKEFGIKPELKGGDDTESLTDPVEVVRGIDQRYSAKQRKRVEAKRKKKLEDTKTS